MSRRTAAVFAFALSLSVARIAGAQGAPEEARQAFQEGVRLLEDARYAEAVAALERSRTLREVAPVLYNLALAYRGTGAYLQAIATFERFLAVATPREPLRNDASAIIAALRAALARVQVRVVGEAGEVRLDDRVIGQGNLERTLAVDPGRHVLEARRPGYRAVVQPVTLSPGGAESVQLNAAESPLPASLRVEVNVDAARIVLDGRPRGRGRFEGEVAPGPHPLEVSASGYLTDRRVLDIAPGATERVAVTLAPRQSVLTRWWFWTGAAVLVTGLTVGGVLLFSGTEPPVPGTWGTAYGAVTAW
jgi:hypothetical protein